MGGGGKADWRSERDVRQVNGVKLLARAVSGVELKDLAQASPTRASGRSGQAWLPLLPRAEDGKAGIVVWRHRRPHQKRFNAVDACQRGAEAWAARRRRRPSAIMAAGRCRPDGSNAHCKSCA